MSRAGRKTERQQVLTDLVNLQMPVEVLRSRVQELPWDSPVDEVELTPGHVLHVLALVDEGVLSPAEVSAWAELIESREDIGFSGQAAAELRNFIFEAANPEINNIDASALHVWRERLSASGAP